MFKTNASWDQASNLLKVLLNQPNLRTYKIVEVEAQATIFHLEVTVAVSCQENLTSRYLSTSLATVLDQLSSEGIIKAKLYSQNRVAESSAYKIDEVTNIFLVIDEDECDNLIYSCVDGKFYLDGAGEVMEPATQRKELIWSIGQ